MIVVIVSARLGKLLHQYGDIDHIPHNNEFRSLARWLKKHQARLKATFPGIEDANMQVYFELETAEDASDQLLDALRGLEEIEGAYIKPSEDLPS